MKCENCGMGFIITPINVDKVCPHCGHIHGNDYVEHTHDDGVTHAHEGGDVPHTHEEDNMVKKIVKWIWNIVCWPFKKSKRMDWIIIMEIARMNYYFTGLLIVMLVVLAFCGGPHVQ